MGKNGLSQRPLVIAFAVIFILTGVTLSPAFADDPPVDNTTEEVLRSAMVESLQGQVAQICKEMLHEAPSISVTADLSEVLRAFPENLSTSPTVRCHAVPGMAVTSDNWPHLAEVYAESDEGARRISLGVGLGRKEDVLSVSSVSVKSVESYGRPSLQLATGGKKKLSFDLCGVSVSLKPSHTYVFDVDGRRLGAIYEGDGELVLKPTCSRAWAMLSDFIDPDVESVAISKIFFVLPNSASKREPKALVRLRKQIDTLHPLKSSRTGTESADEAADDFLNVCVDAASPHQDESALEGLAPCDGYEHASMVVQTKELGAFAFSFAGERGSETVIMTQPRTRSIVSFWETSRAHRDWLIPRVKHYSFDIKWLPEDMRFDVKCDMALLGFETEHALRFLLNQPCRVRRCVINGNELRFAQRLCFQEDKVALALSSGLVTSWVEGYLQIIPPKELNMSGENTLSVEYSIEYGSASETDSLGAWLFYDSAVVLHGDSIAWYPCAGWTCRAPIRTRIEVPTGFMGVAMGNAEAKEVRGDTEVYVYDADFPALAPAFAVGKFTEFVKKTRRLDELKHPVIKMLSSGDKCIAQRYLDVVGTMVDWALKYCGDFPYDELRFVTMPGCRSWATMLVFPKRRLEQEVTNFWLMSHEVSHQWWGNAACTVNADDHWMIEGAATYFSFLCLEDLNMYTSLAGVLKRYSAWIRKLDSPPAISTGFRLASDLRMLFYYKGAFVFEMLRMATNNDRHFFATLKQYRKDAERTGLTEPGIRSCFEKATGLDLSGLFSLYVHRGELPDVLVEVTEVSTKGNRATVSLAVKITPSGYAIPYPIDVFRKSGLAPRREVIFIGPDSGGYKFEVQFADVSRIVGNPDAMLLVADAKQEDVELYVAPE